MASVDRQNDAIATRRARLNKDLAEDLLANGVLKELFRDALDAPSQEQNDAFGLLAIACRRVASELQIQEPSRRAEWTALVATELDSRPDRQISLRDGLLLGLAASHKPTANRALEILHAGIALCLACSANIEETDSQAQEEMTLHFLAPLADAALAAAPSNKHATLVLGHLVPLVPLSQLPPDALERALHGIAAFDFPAHHGRVVAALLERGDYLALRAQSAGGDGAGGDGAAGDSAGAGVGASAAHDTLLAAEISNLMLSSADSTRTHIGRHALPPLLAAHPGVAARVLHAVLAAPSSSADAHAATGPYVDVAAVLIAQGLAGAEELDQQVLRHAMAHRDGAVRLAAMRCLVGGPSAGERMRAETLGLVREWLALNDNVHHAEFRNIASSLVARLCVRFDMSVKAARRVQKKKAVSDNPTEAHAAAAYIGSIQDNLDWILRNIVDTAIRLPLTTNHARMVIALEVLAAVSSTSVAQDLVQLWSPARVHNLLACLGSNFTEIRDRAMSILMTAPDPLPGYTSAEDRAFLFACAHDSLLGARNTQADAGQLLLRLLFLKSGPAAKLERAAFVQSLVDRLEAHVLASERDLAQGLAQLPLHGLLSAIAGIVPFLPLTQPAEVEPYLDSTHRLRDLIARVWTACAPVLSLSDEGGADHEIARVYDMLDAEDADQGEHLVLLSGCWRAMKEAAHLLATLISTSMAKGIPSESLSLVWSVEDVRTAGNMFLQWLHAIRHRGAFSSIAPSFELFVLAVRDSGAPFGGEQLCRSWLEAELAELQATTTSTTRRSAAMPFRIMALVHVHKALFLHAVQTLQNTAADDAKTDTVQTHALNVMRVLILDGRHAHLLEYVAERTAIIALSRIVSRHWNVKNAALLLFAGVTSRVIGKQVNMAFSSIARPTALSIWSRRYPALLSLLQSTLRVAKSDDSHRMAIYPTLSVLRNLQADTATRERGAELLAVTTPFLGDNEWLVRHVAGEACAALVLLGNATSTCKAQLEAYRTATSPNLRHGRLLYARALLQRHTVAVTGSAGCMIGDAEDSASIALCELDQLGTSTLPEQAVLVDIQELLGKAGSPSVVLPFGWSGTKPQPGYLALGSDILHPAHNTELNKGGLPTIISVANSDAQTWRIAMDASEDDLRRVTACNILYNGIAETSAPPRDTFAALLKLAASTHPVTLAEAALRLLPQALSDDRSALDSALALVELAADDDKSLASRWSGLDCLKAVSARAELQDSLKSDLHFLRLVLKLLSDDDDDIRQGGALIVSTLRVQDRPLCRNAAAALWWSAIVQYHSQALGLQATEEWLIGLVCDKAIIDRHQHLLRTGEQALFAPEPSNLFRQDYDTMAQAAEELRQRKISAKGQAAIKATLHRLAAVLNDKPGPRSPIHPQGDSARLLALLHAELLSLSPTEE